MITSKISTQGVDISTFQKNDLDYISLTDIARFRDKERTDYIIQNWMRTRDTIEFLGIWERINNSHFKPIEFEGFKNNAGSNSFSLTPKKWIEAVNAIGIINKSGRHGGGTFAHKDIAFEFATWISPEFKLYLIKEFQRLKIEENERLNLGWDAKRMPRLLAQDASVVYATEADVLNKALFGMTAKEWRSMNPQKEGNIRDYSSVTQLVCLSNLENINAEYIHKGISQSERLLLLNENAIFQMKSLIGNSGIRKWEKY